MVNLRHQADPGGIGALHHTAAQPRHAHAEQMELVVEPRRIEQESLLAIAEVLRGESPG